MAIRIAFLCGCRIGEPRSPQRKRLEEVEFFHVKTNACECSHRSPCKWCSSRMRGQWLICGCSAWHFITRSPVGLYERDYSSFRFGWQQDHMTTQNRCGVSPENFLRVAEHLAFTLTAALLRGDALAGFMARWLRNGPMSFTHMLGCHLVPGAPDRMALRMPYSNALR